MGGHGHGHDVHIHYNHNAFEESDEDMQGKIQRIDLIKFNPKFFHRDVFCASSWFDIMGGNPTFASGVIGALLSYSYFASQSRAYNMYTHIFRTYGRLGFGMVLGLAFGMMRFGDRQRLHNAYVAERLMRRYPESKELHEHHLWRCKGIKAPHEYYKWV